MKPVLIVLIVMVVGAAGLLVYKSSQRSALVLLPAQNTPVPIVSASPDLDSAIDADLQELDRSLESIESSLNESDTDLQTSF